MSRKVTAQTPADEEILSYNNVPVRGELAARDQRLRELEAYVDGLETALRSMRRIVIQNGGTA